MRAQHGKRIPTFQKPLDLTVETSGSEKAKPNGNRRGTGCASYSGLDPKEAMYDAEVITDTLWLLGGRDKSGAHSGDYHGNFVPQIPHQLILRFTRPGDVVLDPFCGSGTTLIECKRLGRNGVGVELLPDVAAFAKSQIGAEGNPQRVHTAVVVGDSTLPETFDQVKEGLAKWHQKQVQLAMLHPPYHNIIQFSDDPRDLCNCPDVEAFLAKFEQVVRNLKPLLAPKAHVGLVIGDMYQKSEVIPLGFLTMKRLLECGFQLKGINVKDIVNNRAKRNQERLWRYRALAGGFYIFKHEYIFVARKQK